jgi:hypothetical protein
MTAASVYAALATLPSEEQARFHLRAVLPEILGHESIEIRCLNANALPPRKGPRVFVSGIDEAVEAAMTMRRDWDVFFGVGTRTCPDGRTMKHCAHQEKGKDHVARLACMWGDFDTHSKSFDDVRGELEALALPPDVLVASGRGLHAYWKLTEATTDFKTIEGLNRSLRLRFGADNAVDASRILRVAGTFNYKYGEGLPVWLVSCHV